MAKNRLYYHVKPFLPWRLRMAMRAVVARRKRQLTRDVWPISPTSGNQPEGWPGWPDGKKFAVLLMHDVEGASGVAKCQQLMELERKLGFRSVFNFIPEGTYEVTRETREELTKNGFEVGVHDLRHDGKLYWSRKLFSENAERINKYLSEWGAKGFRSGFMLHNLEWLHDLDIRYDASTFDTDPFEPQPDNADTIFPFWVSGPNGGGYVELPYTLPQDSTLFFVLKDPPLEIWKNKLDWLVERGAMALLPVHPDYMNFEKSKDSHDEYSCEHYREFLQHIASRYAGQYWNPTPAELAEWYRETVKPALVPARVTEEKDLSLKGRKAAVVLYSYYPADPRPCREAEALVKAGMEVDLLCLRQNVGEPVSETINGVKVRRLPIQRRRDGKLTYVLQYGMFIAMSTLILLWRSLRKKYDLVHVHNMPDVLVFSGIAPKLRGARVILDLHDPMPELMMTIFGIGKDSAAIRLIRRLEKWSIAFADHVVTVNLACKKIFAARSCAAEKIQVVMNSPDENIFKFAPGQPIANRDSSKPFTIMYHGSIVERHGLDLAVEAIQALSKTIPNIELQIYGAKTPFLETVLKQVEQAGLQKTIRYLGSKNLGQIAAAIRTCDLGIIPNRKSVFTEINTPTRIFEYLSLGKPAIAPSVAGITDYFKPGELVFFELGNAEDLARQIQFVYDHPAEVTAIVERGQGVYLRHSWTQEGRAFVTRVAQLLAPKADTAKLCGAQSTQPYKT